MTELRHLARFASKLRLEDVSREVVNGAKYCVLDSMGAALGAVDYEEIPMACEEIRSGCLGMLPARRLCGGRAFIWMYFRRCC